MGFKKVSIEELETALYPAFIGVPLKQVEETSLGEEEENIEEKMKRAQGERSLEIPIINEEVLEFSYDNDKVLTNFVGSGKITVINTSKKDRIWDVNLDINNIEQVNLDEGEIVNFGTFEPQTNKNFQYSLENFETFSQPLQINEEIKINDIVMRNHKDVKKNLKEHSLSFISLSSEGLDIEELRRKEQKIKREKKNKINKKIDKWTTINKDLIIDLESTKNNLASIINKKETLLEKVMEQISGDENAKELEEYKNIINNLKDEINGLKEQIDKTENEHPQKIEEAKEDIAKSYDPKLNDLNESLSEEKTNREAAEQKRDDFKTKEKEAKNRYKDYKSELKKATKEKKRAEKDEMEPKLIKEKFDPEIKDLEEKKTFEEKEQDRFSDEYSKWKDIEKDKSKLIKSLEDQIEALTEEKQEKTEEKVEKVIEAKDKKIESLQKLLEKKQNELNQIKSKFSQQNKAEKEIEDKYTGQINELKEKIEKIENQLNESEQKTEKWNKKLAEIESQVEGFDEIERHKTTQKESFLQAPDNFILRHNQENNVEFKLSLINTSKSKITNIRIGKRISSEFYEVKSETDRVSNIEMKRGIVICHVAELGPGDPFNLKIIGKIKPVEKKIIQTGDIQISYNFENIASGISIDNFSGYSHARHAIKIKEKEKEPNNWTCSLIFVNNSSYNMSLNSVEVLGKNKDKKFLYEEFKEREKKLIISPGQKYNSKPWEIEDKNEPKFYRKLKYSILGNLSQETKVIINMEDQIFNISELMVNKSFSHKSIKSFERTEIENIINIKNTGTQPIKTLLVRELIPKNFLPNFELQNFKIRSSSGKITSEQLDLSIFPEDKDPSTPHEIRLLINIDDKEDLEAIDVNDFLEIRYNIVAVDPDFRENYEFPIEIYSYYPVYQEKSFEGLKTKFYKIETFIPRKDLPKLKIIHKRRDILVSKEIYPGRAENEFGISVLVSNKSNIEINDVNINDTISKTFELVSANILADTKDAEDKDFQLISFNIESILPHQEFEIRYYVRSKKGSSIGFEELESYIYG